MEPVLAVFQGLELFYNRRIGRNVSVGLANVLPADITVPVQDKYGRSWQAVAQQVKDFILGHHLSRNVVENRELQPQFFNDVIGSLQVVGAYGQDFGIERGYLGVVFLQLYKLPAAVDSPESPVENQHHILLPDVRVQRNRLIVGGGKSKSGRRRLGRLRSCHRVGRSNLIRSNRSIRIGSIGVNYRSGRWRLGVG